MAGGGGGGGGFFNPSHKSLYDDDRRIQSVIQLGFGEKESWKPNWTILLQALDMHYDLYSAQKINM